MSNPMRDTFLARVAGLSWRILALLGACLLASGPARAQAEQAQVIEIADYRSYLAADHPVQRGMRKFAQLVEAGSEGRLRVHVRTDALPGAPARQLAALREGAGGAGGAPQLMLVASTGLAGEAPAFALLDLPFLVRDEAHADALLDGRFGAALLARLAQPDSTAPASRGGLVGLAWWENGLRQITTAGAPVRSVADLRGLKLRTVDEPVFIEGARAMGADPVPLPFGELAAALRAGQVVAQDNFMSQILAGRLHELQSSLTLTNHSYSALVLVANAAAWQALDPAQRRLVQAAATEAGHEQRRAARDQAHQAREQLARAGLAIHALAPGERERLRAMTAPLRATYFERHGEELWRLYQEGGVR